MEQDISLLGHLSELRSKLLKSFVAILVCFLPLIPFANDIYLIISNPLQEILPSGSSMIATEVASPFLAPLKITFFVSLLISIPYMLLEIWSFIAPGMYKNERTFASGIILSSLILFYSGILFAYFIILPLVFSFFMGSAPEGIVLMTDISRYLDFTFSIFFAFGFSFEIPILIILLCWTGISSVDSLVAKRPYILISCFVFGMLITPPDIISQILLAIPAYLLFELGLIGSRLIQRQKED
ncbi:MAG: twin-arginine translocase subunit TatC [Gammaproteobacteria bacterium]